MKLHADPRNASLNTVTGYSAAGIEINAVAFPHSIVVAPEGPVASWGVQDIAALDADVVSRLANGQPELVVLGTGRRQRFPHPRVAAQLAGQRIGLEVMDTAAACRTYNILMAEGRRVVGAFIIESELSS